MPGKKRVLKTCNNGHEFYKTSDCSVCPICEKERKPEEEFLSKISAPARRALESVGAITLEELSKHSEKDILALHGMGPSTIPKLKKALKSQNLSFTEG